jgi:hypothetical protein
MNFSETTFTAEAWVYLIGTNAYGGIVDGYQNNWEVLFDGSTGRKLSFYNFASTPSEFNGNTQLNTNTWYHVAAVIQGTSGKLYVNGVEDKSFTMSANVPTGVTRFNFGASISGAPQYLNGRLDDVRIYNYARTQAQIAWDYNRGKPVGHWRMDEKVAGQAVDTSAGYIKDDSDNNNDGTASATTWAAYATGKFGSALSFDGNDYVDCGEGGGSLDFGTSDFTVDFWIKYTGSTTVNQVFDVMGKTSSHENTAGYLVWITTYSGSGSNYGIIFTTTNGSWGTGNVEYPGQFLPNTWYHIAGVRSGNTWTVYKNGVYGTSGNKAGIGVNVDNSINFKVGDVTTSGNFNGSLDDVRIYNYARTAEQILQDYNAGAAARLGD